MSLKENSTLKRYFEDLVKREEYTVDNKTYYLASKYDDSIKDDVYYVIGYDEYLKDWYCDRMPQKSFRIKCKSLPEILDVIYLKNEGATRLNEDILVKKCTLTEGEFDQEVITRTQVINGEVSIERARLNTFSLNWRSFKSEMDSPTVYRKDEGVFRKNITIEGEAYNSLSLFHDYKNCVVYSNGKEIFRSDKPVTFKSKLWGDEGYKELRSYLYYKELDIDISFDVDYEKVNGYCLANEDGEYLAIYPQIEMFDKKSKFKIFIGNHQIKGSIKKFDGTDSLGQRGRNEIVPSKVICFGKFEMIDELGDVREYGEEGFVYVLNTSPVYYARMK